MVKNPPANARDTRDMGLVPWVGRISWRRKWEPAPVFFPGKKSMDRGALWATVHKITGQTQLRWSTQETQWAQSLSSYSVTLGKSPFGLASESPFPHFKMSAYK